MILSFQSFYIVKSNIRLNTDTLELVGGDILAERCIGSFEDFVEYEIVSNVPIATYPRTITYADIVFHMDGEYEFKGIRDKIDTCSGYICVVDRRVDGNWNYRKLFTWEIGVGSYPFKIYLCYKELG